MKNYLLILLFLCSFFKISLTQNIKAQEDNVLITTSIQNFEFKKGSKARPVFIYWEDDKTYTCLKYRTTVPVSEVYNKMETIDNIDISIDRIKDKLTIPDDQPYNDKGIFHSDQRICYFDLKLPRAGSVGKVQFKKSILEPYYFTTIYFGTSMIIKEQIIRLTIPDWMDVDIKEFNFDGYKITRSETIDGKNKIIEFISKDIPAFIQESRSPGPGYFIPHLLVLCKSATIGDRKITYFNTLDDQYQWYKNISRDVNGDTLKVKKFTDQLVGNVTDTKQKVKLIYHWIQNNIRYIAFEDGMAGFVPDIASAVLDKKYGDCKGMANLMTEMLRSQGIDARKCWIGTRHIKHDYSTPSLSVDNHMICAWMDHGRPVFLDPTETYIGLNEVAERIQGRQVLIENGEHYILETVPVSDYSQNTTTYSKDYIIEGHNLKGHVNQGWKGENKEFVLSLLNGVGLHKKETTLKELITGKNQHQELKNIILQNDKDCDLDLLVSYDVLKNNAVTQFENSSYLEVDDIKFLESLKIDLVERKLPYQFSFKDHSVVHIQVRLPSDSRIIHLPEPIKIENPKYSFSGNYSIKDGIISYNNEAIIKETNFSLEELKSWNQDVARMSEFYKEQVEYTLD